MLWEANQGIPSHSYTCGHCNASLASESGWYARGHAGGPIVAFIYLCHRCTKPTYIHPGMMEQVPGAVFGNPVKDIPQQAVSGLYEEARNTTGVGAYTAAVLCCRKLLMHIAVSKGAESGKSFVYYVEYLAEKSYVHPDAKEWVDHIRKKGNEANHEIVIMEKEDAEDLLSFCEMLLKVIFEFPAAAKRKTTIVEQPAVKPAT